MRDGGISRATRLARELDAVDVIAAIGRQTDVAASLEIVGARLGELASNTTHLHHRHGGAEGQDDCHLQEHAQGVADIVGVEFGEALGAIPALKQERLALGDLCQ